MKGKTISTLEQLDAEMGTNGHKAPAKKAPKASKPAVTKNKPPVRKVAPKEKFAFRVHVMAYNDKTKLYGKCAQEEFNELHDVLTFVEKQVEKGQGDGLHEVAIHVR